MWDKTDMRCDVLKFAHKPDICVPAGHATCVRYTADVSNTTWSQLDSNFPSIPVLTGSGGVLTHKLRKIRSEQEV